MNLKLVIVLFVLLAGSAASSSHAAGQSSVIADSPSFVINAGLNDAWVSDDAPFQGFFFTVFPELGVLFLSWFTFDSVMPGGVDTAVFGADDQRWVTGAGAYSGDSVTINVELTSGGIFNGSEPQATQQPVYGTITIEFISCNEALLTYDFPSIGWSGETTLTRVISSNIALCQQLNVFAQTQASLTIPDGSLPDGVTPDDITLDIQMSSPAYYAEQGVEPPLAHISLGPDGLQFSEPVTLHLEVPVEDSSGHQLQVLLVNVEEPLSEGEPPDVTEEIIAEVVSEVNKETNMLTASIPLSHFSQVWTIYKKFMFKLETNSTGSDVLFGNVFEMGAKLTRSVLPGELISVLKLSEGKDFLYMGHAPGHSGNDAWFLGGDFKSTGPVTPETISDRPPWTQIAVGQTHTISPEKFLCHQKAGFVNVIFGSDVAYYLQSSFIASDSGAAPSKPAALAFESHTFTDTFNCLMPKITVTGSPPIATYTITPGAPGGATSYAWTGTNCGSVTGATTNTLVWDHGEADCAHGGTNHDDATISVAINGTFPASAGNYELECTYVGSAVGDGMDCVRKQ